MKQKACFFTVLQPKLVETVPPVRKSVTKSYTVLEALGSFSLIHSATLHLVNFMVPRDFGGCLDFLAEGKSLRPRPRIKPNITAHGVIVGQCTGVERESVLLTAQPDSSLAMLSLAAKTAKWRQLCCQDEMYYDVAKTAIKDKSMLGTHGEELCENLKVQWMTLSCDAAKKRRSKCLYTLGDRINVGYEKKRLTLSVTNCGTKSVQKSGRS